MCKVFGAFIDDPAFGINCSAKNLNSSPAQAKAYMRMARTQLFKDIPPPYTYTLS